MSGDVVIDIHVRVGGVRIARGKRPLPCRAVADDDRRAGQARHRQETLDASRKDISTYAYREP